MKTAIWSKSMSSSCPSLRRYFHLKKLKAWTLDEENLLIKGIEEYGVGEWERIRRDFLPDWVGAIRTTGC